MADLDVKNLQKSLNILLQVNLTEDGKMGPQTQAAVKQFQSQEGLTADGICGPKTLAAMEKKISSNKNLQKSLNFLLHSTLVEDGIIGPKTQEVIKQFQKQEGLTADGICGPNTAAAITKKLGNAATDLLKF